MKIFVSYSSEDRALADAVAVGLRQDGHQVFFDRDNLPESEGYHGRIRDHIAECDLFIFLITPGSISSKSYAMTELALARERWPNPSGHVLPVLARATPPGDIPAYLAAVTYVQGAGNVTAETLAAVSRIARRRRRTRFAWIGAATGALAVCGVAAAWLWPTLMPAPKPCYLSVQVAKDSEPRSSAEGLVVDISYKGGTSSFMVSPDGTASIHVGPLPTADSSWELEVRSATDDAISRQPIQGCPRSATAYSLGRGFNVTLTPR